MIKKYDQVEKSSCGQTYWELKQTPGGDWVRMDDLTTFLSSVYDAIGCGCGGVYDICETCSALLEEVHNLKNI